ncbi:endosome-associated-trafficking regulator 1 [Halyomorpha halys]|uniref:endosome-associated-trafficking regulator 1 n=1 Tax=Halyomorpha halys TaxID=286706 RepID=UPI0006D4CCDE|nr:serologically defined colon cancer antigen 3 homolog [Halyomorpha halys]
MAEDDGANGRDLNYFSNKTKGKGSESNDSSEENEEAAIALDIGLGNNNQHKSRNLPVEGAFNAACSSSDSTRREENPFSFKHFLSRESHGGARPKVYPTPTPPPSPSPRLMSGSEVTSGLPDFVQDHLVIEQCYLSSGLAQQHLSVDLDSISQFAGEYHNYSSGQDLPFDLTSRPDLGQQPEVGTSKSLPDFLSDGPIRNERGQPTPSPSISPERRTSSLQIENERLRRELDVLRRQLSDQIVRSETLETELSLLKERDRSGLENLIEQLEDNLRRSRKRADEAENRASKLKVENNALRCELETFRSARGGRGESAASSSAQQTDNERLASQLRNAANNAELSLRHLLIGVDNLRILAASIEIQPQQPIGLRVSSSEDSQDDEPGPAL